MKRILVVDDDDTIRAILKLIFSRCGFRVVSAINGSDAIRAFDRDDYDLVITDICMPVCDGNSLASYIKEQGCSVPIVAYTGSAESAGPFFDQVLHKPASRRELVDVGYRFLDVSDEAASRQAH